MGCNCGQGGNQQAQTQADAARRASVAQKPRQIPERLRKYYEVPPPGADANKER